jgi:quinol monooxygenase YgiN
LVEVDSSPERQDSKAVVEKTKDKDAVEAFRENEHRKDIRRDLSEIQMLAHLSQSNFPPCWPKHEQFWKLTLAFL